METDISFDHLSMVMQGYFFAKSAGKYIFSSGDGVDNQLLFYTRETALGAGTWTRQNADYDAIRINTGTTSGSKTLELVEGEIVPITIVWINGGGPGWAKIKLTTPDDVEHLSTAGFFSLPCPKSDFVTPLFGKSLSLITCV